MSAGVDALYQQVILDHYRHPHHAGLREPYDAQVQHVNPTCGDEVTLRVRLDGELLADVSYDALGCSISQAAASVMADLVVGAPLPTVLDRHERFLALMQARGAGEPDVEELGDAVAFSGVARYPARVKCALLAWMAMKDAVARAAAGSSPVGTSSNRDQEVVPNS